MNNMQQKKIWIDLDNSPHVPFFNPIKNELVKRGFQVVLTARDCFQVCGLADLYQLNYQRIGRHYGKNKLLKVLGTILRSLQLLPIVKSGKPALAVSHGSRSQLITSKILNIPSIKIYDYEYTQGLGFMDSTWEMAPDILVDAPHGKVNRQTLKYHGLKEEVYTLEFTPDDTFRTSMGLSKEDMVAAIRPPATEAHYHNPEAEKLFIEVVNHIGGNPNARMVILPRNEITQKEFIQNTWPQWIQSRKIIIPEQVVNGLDLIWASDFVVSGGGTMNREAAALNVPVYSIFRGKLGNVDRHLSETGRLTLIRSIGDVRGKIELVKRDVSGNKVPRNRKALEQIVEHIIEKIQ